MESDRVPSAEEQALLAHIIADPADDLRRLVFADWLEEHGQGQRAAYIRARCALDGKRPEFGTYADAVEQLQACSFLPKAATLPAGFIYPPIRGTTSWWWDDRDDAMERGLSSFATVVPGSEDEALAARNLVELLPDLIRSTPIRGLDLRAYLRGQAATLFSTPAATQLTRLSFQLLPATGVACPVVTALASSPVAVNLTRLGLGLSSSGEFSLSVEDDATVDALASASFKRLQRFDARNMNFSDDAGGRLMDAHWFRRLHRLDLPVPPGYYGSVKMPHLHTLCMWRPPDDSIEPFGVNAVLPGLRRLFLEGADLQGDQAESLAGLRCGKLVELWFRDCSLNAYDVELILAAPWARRLEVITFENYNDPDPDIPDVIDDSPCAKRLRIRRILGD